MREPSKTLPPAFQIGLKPILRDRHWLSPIDGLGQYLTQKNALLERKRSDVFADMGETDVAQREAFEIIGAHLADTFPDLYSRSGDAFFVSAGGQRFDVRCDGEPPLIRAAKLIADDLVIMRKSSDGWRLAAGCVCFPSVWKLREKIGLVMAEVHEPVPGFNEGSRHAVMIERIFDNLPIGQTVERGNWSVHDCDDLYLPEHRTIDARDAARLFLRGEVQTLTKLSSGTDILFTIGVTVDPLKALATRPDIAQRLAQDLMQLNGAQVSYKGLSKVRERLNNHLITLSGQP